MVAELLRDEAARVKGVIETFEPGYPSKATCLEAVDRLMSDRSLVTYTQEGAQEVYESSTK